MKEMKCENCGAPLTWEPGNDRGVCPYCDSCYTMPVEEVQICRQELVIEFKESIEPEQVVKTGARTTRSNDRKIEKIWINLCCAAMIAFSLFIIWAVVDWPEPQAEPMTPEEWAQRILSYDSSTPKSLAEDMLEHGFSREETDKVISQYDWANEAVDYAKNRTLFGNISRSALVNEMTLGGYTREQAEAAADDCGAGWSGEAYSAACDYEASGAYTHTELVRQLMRDGYTAEEVEYAMERLRDDKKADD